MHSDNYEKNYTLCINSNEYYTGLCFDIGLIKDGNVLANYNELLKEDNTYKKIIKLLPKYGFILRYPKSKEQITGCCYEPWHYRYVGSKTANIIANNNLTLEDYNKLYNKSGIILVNKPKGITSRDAVNKISKIFNTPKVGHNGTLDPLAEGLLVMTINKATKINELLTNSEKEYIAKVKVGILTDTLDLEGNVIERSNKKITKESLIDLFNSFPRNYFQEVPKYSAIKINGKKLYEYARNNEEVILPKREVIIKDLELSNYNDTSFEFRVVVSKGTYIRSIIRDMGNILNIPCTMSSLIRTRCGKFLLKDAIYLDEVNINSYLFTISDALNLPIAEISDYDYKYVFNGAAINDNYGVKDKVLFVKNKKIIAILKIDRILLIK